MKEKEERIRKMVAEGKISQEEAKKLLDALKESERKEEQRTNQMVEKTLKKKTSGLAIASLVLGGLAFCLFIFGGIGLPLGILAIIFGGIALKGIRKEGLKGKGMAAAGLILGIVGTFLSLLVVLALVFFQTAFLIGVDKIQKKKAKIEKVKAKLEALQGQKDQKQLVIDSNDHRLIFYEGKWEEKDKPRVHKINKTIICKDKLFKYPLPMSMTEDGIVEIKDTGVRCTDQEPTILISEKSEVTTSTTQLNFPGGRTKGTLPFVFLYEG